MAGKSRKRTKPLPICKAILLCDDVTRDEETHKTNVIGIFDTFQFSSFPGLTSPSKIFLRLADAVGRYSITAEVHDTEHDVILFRSPGSGEFGNLNEAMSGELWLPVAELRFEGPGEFDMVVFADGIELARTDFNVKAR
jgi:hypothetical protein